jgi:putative sigma-54 modulation protein
VAMLPEEAAAQLDLLGHDVVVFTNRATGGFGVVYRRPDGDLGLLESAEESRPAEPPVRH